jgi:UDP-N-acetylglucosamine/UDP-N-acetylgalactosamine diphosphorylase
MNDKYKQVIDILKKYKQEHLLQFYNQLNKDEKAALIDEILETDFDLIQNNYDKIIIKNSNINEMQLKPLKSKSLKNCSATEKLYFYETGMSAISEGKVAAYLVAGGQGSRLGHKGPKGTFDIGLPSGKSLFQLQCERLRYLSKKAGRYIPFYIMTSPENHKDTVDFFDANNYFGYEKTMIMFFKQKTMPSLDEAGKILLSEMNKIAKSPNGNGGCFLALKESGALSDMKNRGVEWLFLYGVDNALVRVADPYFIGFTICTKHLAATKVIEKKTPYENLGNLCYKNGIPAILEYSEIPGILAEERNSEGKLLYSNGSILNHILSVNFIESIVDKTMPLHIAHKKIEFINENGTKIIPDKPNGYKFEYFLFDIFERLEDISALEVEREEEFAPVKNSYGEESPKTSRDLILSLHKKWLIEAGVDSKNLEGKQIEISPLISYYGDNLSDNIIKEIL